MNKERILFLVILIIGIIYIVGCKIENTVKPFSGEISITKSDEGLKLKKDGIAGISISFSNPEIVFVLTGHSGIYKSCNGGKTFQRMSRGLPQEVCAGSFSHLLNSGLTMDKRNPKIIYGSFNGQIYKSIDEGESWIWSSKGTSVRSYDLLHKDDLIMGVIIDPNDSNHLLASTIASGFFGGVFESKDGCKNWRYIAGNGKPFSGIGNDAWPICFDPSNSKRVYACGVHKAFYYSTDGGYTWTRNEPGRYVESSASAIFVFPNKPNQILLGDARRPFISEDYGKNWEVYPLLKGMLTSIESAPSDPNIIYAISSSHGILYRTTNGGETWKAFLYRDKGLNTIAIHPKEPFIVYLGSDFNGLYKSINGGKNLIPIEKGLPERDKWLWVTQILPDPKNPNQVYAVDWENGLYKSVNKGKTWNFVRYSRCGEVAISKDTIYLSGLEGLYSSKDEGKTWTQLYELQGESLIYAISPHNTREVWLVDNGTKEVFLSMDEGKSWNLQSIVDKRVDFVTQIAIDPQEPARIYLATYNYPLKSENKGKTWKILKRGIKGGYTKELIKSLIIVPSGEVYILSQGGGIFKSTNKGALWKRITPFQLNKGEFYTGQIAISDTGTIFFTSEKGLFVSYDKGSRWIKLVDSPYFYAFGIDPHQHGRYYAGGIEEEGIYIINCGSFSR